MKCRTLLATTITLAACGGATQTPLDTQSNPDASSGGDGASGPCPASAPASNGACSGTIACEYGSDPDVSCDTVATCTSGEWFVRPASGTPCGTSLDPSCPATYAGISQQSTCSSAGAQCSYPEARCSCQTHCGMVGRPEAFWCCPDAPAGTPGCPSPRPRLGSACSSDAAVCDYGGCSGNVTLKCTAGTWQPTQIGCPG